jgi:Icc-related predicted phosphoesterase
MTEVWEPTVAIPDGDVFIHAGDLMRMGTPDEWVPAVEWLAHLPHKHKYFVPGNHDFHLQVYPGPALQQMRTAGINVVGMPNSPNHAVTSLPNGMRMLGLPYVTNLPNWAFNVSEKDLRSHLEFVWPPEYPIDVIVSHMPVFGFLDSVKNGKHVGSTLYREFLNENKPKVWINGHIHEGYGQAVHTNGCRMYNVAMCDRDYRHVNAPAVFDV